MAKVITTIVFRGGEFYLEGTNIIVRGLEVLGFKLRKSGNWQGPDGNILIDGDSIFPSDEFKIEVSIHCDEYHAHTKDSCKVARIKKILVDDMDPLRETLAYIKRLAGENYEYSKLERWIKAHEPQ